MGKKEELTFEQKLEQATSDSPRTFKHTKKTRVEINGTIVDALEIQKEGEANRYGYQPLRENLRKMFGLSVHDPGQTSKIMYIYKKEAKVKGVRTTTEVPISKLTNGAVKVKA